MQATREPYNVGTWWAYRKRFRGPHQEEAQVFTCSELGTRNGSDMQSDDK